MDPRLSVIIPDGVFDPTPVMTYHFDDRTFGGIWSRPNVSALVFADSLMVTPAPPFPFRNGPVGGISTPVQLVFWGSWWTTGAGAARAQMVQSWTQALLNSHYFDELTQYFIASPPIWRGSTFVTAPEAPGLITGGRVYDAVTDLINDLIADDVFPEPDDGPRIAFIVCMPEGFQPTDGSDEGHTYGFSSILDEDRFWWARCDAAVEDPENMMPVIADHLVEMLTDPEFDGWIIDVENDPHRTFVEINDVALSTVSGGGQVRQTAWVNDVKVPAYWSNRHGACVIPIDHDYSARLFGTVVETSRTPRQQGTFRPEPSDSAACGTAFPECCMEDRDYAYAVYEVTETAHIDLETQRYRDPTAAWTINGKAVSGSGTLTLALNVDVLNGRDTITTTSSVDLAYEAQNSSLEITAANAFGNFDVTVGCSVTDSSITGNVATNVVATPSVTVGIVGAVYEVEQSYVDQRAACLLAMLRRYGELHQRNDDPFHRDPLNYDPGISEVVLPAYARVTQYQQVRQAIKLVAAADHLLEPEAARAFIDNLTASIPALVGGKNRLARST